MTVQYWLASNVYRRLPGVSRGMRSVAVMIVSSAWHGVYSGIFYANKTSTSIKQKKILDTISKSFDIKNLFEFHRLLSLFGICSICVGS